MRRILSILLFLLPVLASAQPVYTPNQHIISSTATGYSNATPTDARSQFYDNNVFKYRDYQSTAEVLTYLNLAKSRTGHFPIYVHSGGSLSSGVWTGGSTITYYFKDGTADGDLVLMNAGAGSVVNTSFSPNIPFTALTTTMSQVVTADIAFAPDTVGNIVGYGATVLLTADGIHTPTFSTFFLKSSASDVYNPDTGGLNLITFYNAGHGKYVYTICQLPSPDLTPPMMTARATSDSVHFAITFNESVTGPVTGWSAKKNGSALTLSAVSGTTIRTFTTGSVMHNGDTILVSYNASTGSTTDMSGNELVSFTDSLVVNNLSPAGFTVLYDKVFNSTLSPFTATVVASGSVTIASDGGTNKLRLQNTTTSDLARATNNTAFTYTPGDILYITVYNGNPVAGTAYVSIGDVNVAYDWSQVIASGTNTYTVNTTGFTHGGGIIIRNTPTQIGDVYVAEVKVER